MNDIPELCLQQGLNACFSSRLGKPVIRASDGQKRNRAKLRLDQLGLGRAGEGWEAVIVSAGTVGSVPVHRIVESGRG